MPLGPTPALPVPAVQVPEQSLPPWKGSVPLALGVIHGRALPEEPLLAEPDATCGLAFPLMRRRK